MKDGFIVHSGVAHDELPPGRGSGRYPWGSGENPGQHQFSFLSEVDKLKKRGISEANIAKMLLGEKATSTTLRAEISIERAKARQATRNEVIKVLDECKGNRSAAAREMERRTGKHWNESSVRSILDETIAERTDRYQNTARLLQKKVNETKVLDVSSGTELFMGVPDYTKKVAIAMLEKEGYVKTWIQTPQMSNPNQKTSIMVLAKPEFRKADGKIDYAAISQIVKDGKLGTIQEFTPDQGKTWWVPEFPESLSSKRVYVRYAEEGGTLKDGVIELRRGVEDISLGNSQYAQVRIAVDGTHYMKGMAMYGEDIPKGYDVVYNTNKKKGTPALGDENHTVMKLMKRDKDGNIDPDNPFGASIKSPKEKDGVVQAGGQRKYIGKDGKEHLSPINKLQDEGDWDSWSRNLASQFLSKQPLKLIKQQLDLSVADKREELDSIMRLTNPVIKKKLLDEFADGCDSNAADLSAKGFKNQAFQVILPITSMKETEIYAPRFKDGDTVALVRYPHGGPFEIPILKVNNKQKDAKKVMFDAHDAVGINSKVAEQLSGADFDGDTVLVIPLTSNRINVKSKPYYDALKNWDPKENYRLPDDAPRIKNSTKQNEMGRVTNLINDMTIGGATDPEIIRAVKHSMVVIDSEKHHLDYKQSAKDNGIHDLKITYQGVNSKGQPKGASTILSRAKSKKAVDERKEITDVSKMTPAERKAFEAGKKVYRNTGKTKMEQIKDPSKMTPDELTLYTQGKKVYRQTNKPVQERVHQMDLVDDAMQLVHDPGNQKEVAYAQYANNLKGLAQEARRESRSIKPTPVNQASKKTYAKEVESLNIKLRNAQMNAPKERQAQVIANSISSEKFAANPDMDYEHRQRERSRALQQARAMVGAKKENIVITDREWEAIQANAISTTKLTQILNNTDQESFKQRATPRGSTSSLSPAQASLAKTMASSGQYTQAEIAERLGVSTSTVSSYLNK